MVPRRVGRGRVVDDAHHTLNDVIHVGKIPLHIAVVKYINGLPLKGRFDKQKQRHVRPSPRPIHRKKPKPRGSDAKKMAVRVRHEFVGFFARCVQADGVVYVVFGGKRKAFIEPIHRTARRVGEVVDAMMTTAF